MTNADCCILHTKRDGSPALWGDMEAFMYLTGLLEAVASLVWQHREDLNSVESTMPCFIIVVKQKLLGYKCWNSLNNDLIQWHIQLNKTVEEKN